LCCRNGRRESCVRRQSRTCYRGNPTKRRQRPGLRELDLASTPIPAIAATAFAGSKSPRAFAIRVPILTQSSQRRRQSVIPVTIDPRNVADQRHRRQSRVIDCSGQ
jgi:hypothetical protein